MYEGSLSLAMASIGGDPWPPTKAGVVGSDGLEADPVGRVPRPARQSHTVAGAASEEISLGSPEVLRRTALTLYAFASMRTLPSGVAGRSLRVAIALRDSS